MGYYSDKSIDDRTLGEVEDEKKMDKEFWDYDETPQKNMEKEYKQLEACVINCETYDEFRGNCWQEICDSYRADTGQSPNDTLTDVLDDYARAIWDEQVAAHMPF